MSAGILYLHGFRSSPQSQKARLVASAMQARGQAARFFCPALAHAPHAAIAQAEAILAAEGPGLTLVGSSLGGYYATWLAEKHDLRAVLINPAVISNTSPVLLDQFIGTQTNLYTGESFEFTAEHVGELRALEAGKITPEHYLLMVEAGDEVLDYREAVARYAGSRQMAFEGGDHSFTRFAACLPQLLEYCRL